MKTYGKAKRSTARRWLRWLVAGRVQVDDLRVMMALWAMVLAIVWVMPAHAAPVCPGGQTDGRGRCVYVWRGATCVRVGGLVWCTTVQQPGQVQP